MKQLVLAAFTLQGIQIKPHIFGQPLYFIEERKKAVFKLKVLRLPFYKEENFKGKEAQAVLPPRLDDHYPHPGRHLVRTYGFVEEEEMENHTAPTPRAVDLFSSSVIKLLISGGFKR